MQGQDVPLFVLAVGLAVFLDGIVGEMREVVRRADIEDRTRGPDIAFLEEENFPILRDHRIHPDIKFPTIDQHRLLDILLDQKASLLMFAELLLQQIAQFLNGPEQVYAPATVEIGGLEQPQTGIPVDLVMDGREEGALFLRVGHIDEIVMGFQLSE